MFIDEIKIYARAGHGGKGSVAFTREKYRPKGGPSGGNGGGGGDVILEADHDLNNLIAQYYQPRLIAKDGQQGLGKGMDGHAGKDLLIKVPCGTLVWKAAPEPGEPEGANETEEDEEDSEEPILRTSTRNRPVFRTSGGVQVMEVDLSKNLPKSRLPA
jgi:GTP-binding protein